MPRARRFDLGLDAWFRETDDGEWCEGITQSVSTTGALIQTSDQRPPNDQIAVVIALRSAGCLVGRGRVVRTQIAGSSVTFAVAVERYRIEHRHIAMTTISPDSSDRATPRGDLRVISQHA